jgi:hypothetical protein
MSIRPLALLIFLTACGLLLSRAWAGVAEPNSWAGAAEPSVSYLSGGTVYLNVGRDDGLYEGETVQVVRAGRSITTLEIVGVASHNASCRMVEPAATVRIGDLVRVPNPPSPPMAVQTPPIARPGPSAGTRSQRGAAREGRIRGSADFRTVAVDDRTSSERDYTRPTVDLKAAGERILGSDFGFDLRIQTRQTIHVAVKGRNSRETQVRLYRSSWYWRPTKPGLRVSVGRQMAADLSRVSTFDGLLAEYGRARWSVGLLSGTQPDYSGYGYSTDIREHGGFVKYERQGTSTRQWSVTGGLVGSYYKGSIDREYVFAQWHGNTDRLTTSLAQELDFNRGWKRSKGERVFSVTNSEAYCRFRVVESLAMESGFDDRRNVRLYRFKETPETQFDDTHRQGLWAGVSQSLRKRHHVELRARASAEGSSRAVNSVNVNYSGSWPELSSLRVRTRSTRYDSGRACGWLHSLSAGCSVGTHLAVELTQGVRIEDPGDNRVEQMTWGQVDTDLSLGRHWSFSLSAEYGRGANEDHRTYYSGTRYRF